jgi:hypothetical protein
LYSAVPETGRMTLFVAVAWVDGTTDWQILAPALGD